MRTTLVVIFLATVEQMVEMLLAKDHDVIEVVPPDRSNQPLREQELRFDQPCTQDLRISASQDTVQSEQRSLENGA
jgi:hypothetical protein